MNQELGAHTHLDNHTLAKHGEAVSDSATLAVVPVILNFKDLTQLDKGPSIY